MALPGSCSYAGNGHQLRQHLVRSSRPFTQEVSWQAAGLENSPAEWLPYQERSPPGEQRLCGPKNPVPPIQGGPFPVTWPCFSATTAPPIVGLLGDPDAARLYQWVPRPPARSGGGAALQPRCRRFPVCGGGIDLWRNFEKTGRAPSPIRSICSYATFPGTIRRSATAKSSLNSRSH